MFLSPKARRTFHGGPVTSENNKETSSSIFLTQSSGDAHGPGLMTDDDTTL